MRQTKLVSVLLALSLPLLASCAMDVANAGAPAEADPPPGVTDISASPGGGASMTGKPEATGATDVGESGDAQTGGDASGGDLAKAAQNPIANMISVPIQNNFNFGVGVDDDMQYLLNVQPVIPTKLNEDWNLINRFIVPVLYQPSMAPGMDDEFGLGDIQYQGYFSPSKSGELTWGVGPVLQFPTHTDDSLGSDRWGAGVGVVALKSKGPWLYGALVNNVWGVAGPGDELNQMLVNPFVNYNLPNGWYLTTAPNIIANWSAPSGDRWTVPIGGGIGKVTKIGKQPVNIKLAAYYNLEHPRNAPDWQLQFQVQFLFPKGGKK